MALIQEKPYDAFGIGVSQVDFIAFVSEDYIKRNLSIPYGIEMGSKLVVNQQTWDVLYDNIHQFTLRPSGDVATMMIIYSMLGGKCTLETVIADDDHGKRGLKIMQNSGLVINHNLDPLIEAHTPVRMLYIGPDGKFTTIIKAIGAPTLKQQYVRFYLMKDYKMIVLDASMWDGGAQSQTIMRALKSARHVKTKSVLIIPEGRYIKRYRRELLGLLQYLDVIIMHERSLSLLFGTADDEELLRIAKKHGIMIAYTQSHKGATVVTPQEVVFFKAHDIPRDRIIDKRGAQAAFAAGLLHALNNGKSLREAGERGIILAEYVIQKVGYDVDERLFYELSKDNQTVTK
jgi:sugar/nucleoside kinase (ribokinase family)